MRRIPCRNGSFYRRGRKGRRKREFYQALKQEGISIIGEFKKASPSLGEIKSKIDLTTRMKGRDGRNYENT